MKKTFLVILFFLFFLLLCLPSFASVLIEVNGTVDDHVNTLNLTGPETLTRVGDKLTIPVVDSSLMASGVASGKATSLTTAQTDVDAAYAYYRKAITSNTGYTTGTLADGVPGQRLTIHIVEGSGSWALTPTTSTGISSITFDAVGEIASLIFLDSTTGWVIDGYTNATVALP